MPSFPSRRVETALERNLRHAALLGLVLATVLAGAVLADRTAPHPHTSGANGPADSHQPADAAHTGTLDVLDQDGKPMQALPLQHTDVTARVSGNMAHVQVEQRFANPYAHAIEAVYTFPLPHEAAVNDLEIRIGERVVRGQIRKRQEAREIYEQAKRDGRVAALLDQERPNIFTQSIANIMPGHEIVVRIQYVEQLQYADGSYELVFPTVVGPRFIPGTPLGTPVVPVGGTHDGRAPEQPGVGPLPPQSGTGWAPDTDRVPDASRITPPVLPPGLRSGHDIAIRVELDAGVPLVDLRSENHAVDEERHGESRATVALRPTDTVPNKDFVLRYTVAGKGPEFGWLTYRDSDRASEGYFSLVLQPQAKVSAHEARPKEMIFLIDASGSMSGEPMAKVKAAMRWALQSMNPDDSFQVIRFSESASPLAARPLANTPANVKRALDYIERLRGQGGTHMRAGIEAALRTPADPERLRLVFFMTDGYIGNENEILDTVRHMIGDARLFAFGIGSSVNRFLLDRVAEEGRGVVDYVSLHADTREVVERFYARVAKPYLTDIEIDWGDLQVRDLVPARIPDLFAGQPLVLSGRYTQPGRGWITVRGRLGRRPFEQRVRGRLPRDATQNEEVAILWARRSIAMLMGRMLHGEREEIVNEVTDLALRHRLVSAYTSFVAVDNQVVNADGKTVLVAQPVPMPEGVSYEGVFGAKGERVDGVAKLSRLTMGQGVGRLAKRGDFSQRVALSPQLSATPMPVSEEARELVPRERHTELEDASLPGATPVRRPLPTILPTGPLHAIVVEPTTVRVGVGGEVQVRVTLSNSGTQEIEIPQTLDMRDGSVLVRAQLGDAVVPKPRCWQSATVTTIRLAPGASHTWVVTLSGTGRYAFAVPGTYTVELAIPALGPGAVARCVVEVR